MIIKKALLVRTEVLDGYTCSATAAATAVGPSSPTSLHEKNKVEGGGVRPPGCTPCGS